MLRVKVNFRMLVVVCSDFPRVICQGHVGLGPRWDSRVHFLPSLTCSGRCLDQMLSTVCCDSGFLKSLSM